MNSSDPRNFFETDAVQARRERKRLKSQNKHGDPIKLPSKLNAAVVDPAALTSCVYVAGSGGWIRKVDVDAGEKQPHTVVFRGPQAPVTCVTIGGPGNSLVFGGSWDRNVWSWDVTTGKQVKTYIGHSDFVKAVVCTKIRDKYILISGGADKKIIVWDIESATRLHTLQDTSFAMLAVQNLVVDPIQSMDNEIFLMSSSSDPHIRKWRITFDKAEMVAEGNSATPGSVRHSILEHKTTVYKLLFDRANDEVDLWTSSADGTVKRLSRSRNWAADEIFAHGDQVRSVALTDQWVITAGRDEDVIVWDRGTGRRLVALVGHYEEVTDLVVLRGSRNGTSDFTPDRVCSVSIDGTIRTWHLDHRSLEEAMEKQRKENADCGDADGGQKEGMLTTEEEAELAALMEDNDKD